MENGSKLSIYQKDLKTMELTNDDMVVIKFALKAAMEQEGLSSFSQNKLSNVMAKVNSALHTAFDSNVPMKKTLSSTWSFNTTETSSG
jgi:hypothetical protein